MKSLIVSGGEAPSKKLLKKHSGDAALVIAADSAAVLFEHYSMVPHCVIGDFDSAEHACVERLEQKGARIIKLDTDKNETDTEAAVKHAIRSGAKSIVMLGATGRRTDHALANINMLMLAHQNGVHCRIIDAYNEITIAKGAFELHGRAGQTVSILPFCGDICVSADNVKYPLKQLHLGQNASRGVSNIMTSNTINLSINGGYALVIKVLRDN